VAFEVRQLAASEPNHKLSFIVFWNRLGSSRAGSDLHSGIGHGSPPQ
jgi:hypothetical protein